MLEHINLTTKNPDSVVKFITAVLPNFKVLRTFQFETGVTSVHVGNENQYLAIQSEVRPNTQNRIPYSQSGVNHIGFRVDNIEEIKSKALAIGAKVEQYVEDGDERKRLYLIDETGFEYEFVEYLK